MTCRPLICEGRADCGDKHCPGHPLGPDAQLTRRVQEAELRWQCRDQMSARQLYEHARAGDFGVGNESADPSLVKPPREAMPVQMLGKEPTDWRTVADDVMPTLKWLALGLLLIVIVPVAAAHATAYLMDNWPRIVAALSL